MGYPYRVHASECGGNIHPTISTSQNVVSLVVLKILLYIRDCCKDVFVSFTYTVISEQRSSWQKPMPNTKSLATFSHDLVGIPTQVVVTDSLQSVATL